MGITFFNLLIQKLMMDNCVQIQIQFVIYTLLVVTKVRTNVETMVAFCCIIVVLLLLLLSLLLSLFRLLLMLLSFFFLCY